MSNRPKVKRSERCDGCAAAATHFLRDEDGWTLRSCDFCWLLIVESIEAMGGTVSECGCAVCVRRSAAKAGLRRHAARVRGKAVRPSPRPDARAAQADLGAGNLRGPV